MLFHTHEDDAFYNALYATVQARIYKLETLEINLTLACTFHKEYIDIECMVHGIITMFAHFRHTQIYIISTAKSTYTSLNYVQNALQLYNIIKTIRLHKRLKLACTGIMAHGRLAC